MPQCSIAKTTLFHFELDCFFHSDLPFSIEATPPAEKIRLLLNINKNSEMKLWL